MFVNDDPMQLAAAEALLDEYPDETNGAEALDSTAQDLELDSQALGEASVEAVRAMDVAVSLESFVTGFFERVTKDSRNTAMDVAVSLESFVTGFFERVPEGEWNRKTAQQYEIGMQALVQANNLSLPKGIYAHSFEAATVTETNAENEQKTKDKAQGFLKKISDAVVKAIKAVVAALQNFVKRIGSTAKQIKGAAQNLMAKATKYRGKKADKTTFDEKAAWSSYLVQGSATKSPEDVMRFAGDTALKLINDWMLTYIHAAGFISKAVTGGQAIPNTLASEFNNGISKVPSEWPGYTVTFEGKPEGTSNDPIGDMTKITIKVDKVSTPAANVAVMTPDEVLAVGKMMDSLSDDVGKAEQELERAIAEINRVSANLTTWQEGSTNAEKFSDEIKAMPKIISKLSEGPRKIFPIIASLISSGYKHCDASLKEYGAGPTKPDEKEA